MDEKKSVKILLALTPAMNKKILKDEQCKYMGVTRSTWIRQAINEKFKRRHP